MTLEAELQSLITALGTDHKSQQNAIGVLANLETAATNLVAAINEVKTTADAAVAGTTPDATTTTKGKVELSTNAETLARVSNDVVVTPATLGSSVNVANGVAGLDGTGKVASAQLPTYTPPTASTTAAGDVELATDVETLALASDTVVVTPGNLGSVRNVANGFAGLDGTGKVAAAQLPSYVDDVVEAANFAALPATGETGKIYTTLDNNNAYRWSGSAYVEIAASPGTTDEVTEGSTNLYFTNARADSRATLQIANLIGDTDPDLVAAYTAAKA